jgi:hypothetical protein
LRKLQEVPASTELEDVFDFDEEATKQGYLFEMRLFVLFVFGTQVTEFEFKATTVRISAV